MSKDADQPRPLHPAVVVNLTRVRGGTLTLINLAADRLRRAGHARSADRMAEEVRRCDDYEDAVAVLARYVTLHRGGGRS